MLVTHSNAAREATAALQAKIDEERNIVRAPAVPKPKPEGKGKGRASEKQTRLEINKTSVAGDDVGVGDVLEWPEDEENGAIVVDMRDLVDINTNSVTSALGGRPKKRILDEILQQCYRKPHEEKILYRCLGGCGCVFSNRNTARAIRHAVGCHRLPRGAHRPDTGVGR